MEDHISNLPATAVPRRREHTPLPFNLPPRVATSPHPTRTHKPETKHHTKAVSNKSRPSTAPQPQSHKPKLVKPAPGIPHLQGGKQEVTLPGEASAARPKTPRRRMLSVVLPPRKLSMSSTTLMEELIPPISIRSLHFEESYSPHKAHWIKSALENLGTSWIRDGKTTFEQLMSEEFEEKMAVFYDLAMAKKHDAIDRLVGEEEAQEEPSGNNSGCSGSGAVHKNFPFAPHLSLNVKASMSDALLRIMMKGEVAEEQLEGKNTKEPEEENSNSFERDLSSRKSLVQCYVVDGGKLVFGSKKGLLGVGGSFTNQFGDSKDSRVRKSPPSSLDPSNLGFYRRIANMMGFLPHEVRIRYNRASRQLVVSGARPQRGPENARQVREVLEIPKHVDVRNLVVLRTTKGSLIFEEAEVVKSST